MDLNMFNKLFIDCATAWCRGHETGIYRCQGMIYALYCDLSVSEEVIQEYLAVIKPMYYEDTYLARTRRGFYCTCSNNTSSQ